jgi:SNF2 family DNA or RNA helicase
VKKTDVRSLVAPPLWQTLYPYQRTAVEFVVNRDGHGLISLDMGMGKTLVSIVCMLAMETKLKAALSPANRVVLVVCPAKVCQQFARAIRSWLAVDSRNRENVMIDSDPIPKNNVTPGSTNSSFDRMFGAKSVHDGVKSTIQDTDPTSSRLRWMIMSYGKARLRLSAKNVARYNLTDQLFGLICDESQNMKSWESITTQTLMPVSKKVKCTVLLSGIPLNLPKHLYSQIYVVNSQLGPVSQLSKFLHRYCGPRKVFITRDRYKWQYNGSTNSEELHTFLRHRVMFRLNRGDVDNDGDIRVQQKKTNPACHKNEMPPPTISALYTTNSNGPSLLKPFAVFSHPAEPSAEPFHKICMEVTSKKPTDTVTSPKSGSKSVSSSNNQIPQMDRKVTWIDLVPPTTGTKRQIKAGHALLAKRVAEVDQYSTLKKNICDREESWKLERSWDLVQEAETHEVDFEQLSKQETFMRYRRNTAIFKVEQCRVHIRKYIHERCNVLGEKVLIFAVHTRVLDILEAITVDALCAQSTSRDSTLPYESLHESLKEHICLPALDPAAEYASQWQIFQKKLKSNTTENSSSNSDAPEHLPAVPCFKHVRIDGSSGGGNQVQDAIDHFREDPECKVAILSILAAGAGIEMQAANNVLFVELSFNADDLLQAEARAHRIGQTKPVHVSYLLLSNSVDDAVFQIVKRKLGTIRRVLDDEDASFKLATERVTISVS